MTNEGCDAPIYPCRFPIKVIGDNQKGLKEVIIEVMSSCGEAIDPAEMAVTHSKNKKYISITVTVVARSREHIERIYTALNARKEVKMLL